LLKYLDYIVCIYQLIFIYISGFGFKPKPIKFKKKLKFTSNHTLIKVKFTSNHTLIKVKFEFFLSNIHSRHPST